MEFTPNLVDVSVSPADWARAREAEGWHGLAVADHLWDRGRPYPHVWVALGAMAASTTRVTLTSSFANNLLRSPVEFAQASLAMQQASNCRFEAGLGAGWSKPEVELTGLRYPPPRERVARYREAMVIARALLHDRTCRFVGEFYDIDVEILGPDVPAPPLVAALGGPRSIEQVAPLVDRVELKVSSPATRGGSLDFAKLALVSIDDLDRLVGLVREVRPDVPLGLFLQVGCGTHPRLTALAEVLGGSWFGSFIGEPNRVADSLLALKSHGISRVQLTPYADGTFERLAPLLNPLLNP
jgi:alkanesulfonate monooxygenase SsuD/methylene tetrahydromethanopterin reductase-like flavin-dependent oxidoreductase (luciferase family)